MLTVLCIGALLLAGILIFWHLINNILKDLTEISVRLACLEATKDCKPNPLPPLKEVKTYANRIEID